MPTQDYAVAIDDQETPEEYAKGMKLGFSQLEVLVIGKYVVEVRIPIYEEIRFLAWCEEMDWDVSKVRSYRIS